MRSRRADGTTMTMRHTRANTARVHGPAKEKKGVHGVGTAGQHAKQRAHRGHVDETRQTIYIDYGRVRRAFPELEAERLVNNSCSPAGAVPESVGLRGASIGHGARAQG